MLDKVDWSIAPNGATHHGEYYYYKVVFGKMAYVHTGNYWKKCAYTTNEYVCSIANWEQNPSIRSRLLCKLKVTVNRMAAYVGIL